MPGPAASLSVSIPRPKLQAKEVQSRQKKPPSELRSLKAEQYGRSSSSRLPGPRNILNDPMSIAADILAAEQQGQPQLSGGRSLLLRFLYLATVALIGDCRSEADGGRSRGGGGKRIPCGRRRAESGSESSRPVSTFAQPVRAPCPLSLPPRVLPLSDDALPSRRLREREAQGRHLKRLLDRSAVKVEQLRSCCRPPDEKPNLSGCRLPSCSPSRP
jgi:hypothetical protein